MGREVELKLMAREAQAAERFLGHALIARYAQGEGEALQLSSIYYDTPNFELRDKGMALRVRRSGDRWEQTLKTAGTSQGGLSRRGEWQWALAGPELRPDLVDGALWPPGLKEPAKRLRAVFRTDFQRDIRRIALPAGALEAERASVLIEAAWDRGHISTQGIHPEKVEEICEVELELKQGEPEALFDFALAAAAGLALFPWDMSKAERGYRLLGLSSGRKAASPGGLCVGETTEALFLSCMNGAIGFWIRKVERFYHAGACEYLRDTLAAIQDMGRLLSFFRPLLHDEDRRAWDSAFGHAAERLRRRLGIVSGAVAETVPAWDEADAAMVLSMVRWVYCRGWRDRWDVRHRRMASLPPSLFFGERIDQYKRWFAEADRRWRN